MPIAPGTLIGPYEIVGWLGAGAMGEVYRARDPRLGRDVAIKLIPEVLAEDASRVRRFEQEARAAGQINHPNILAVYDVGTHAGTPFIVSELLEGESLRSRLLAGALPTRKIVDYARQIAEGLAAAHDKGIVHRDLKPDNLFITHDGRVKILDFGVAKLTRPLDGAAGQTGEATATEPGTVVGTAAYMSPEQVRGEGVDSRSDIFSFGAILHEFLAGRPAFARATAAETMTAILRDEPAPPSGRDLAPALARIVSRCLEKPREARFQSARDLAFGLEFLSDSGVTAAARPPASRWGAAVVVAALVLTAVVATTTWMTLKQSRPAAADSPLTNASFERLTDWEGTEMGAEISPDGKFVAFAAERDGRVGLWLAQVGTAGYRNLAMDLLPLQAPRNILRTFGFSGDGQEIWFDLGNSSRPKTLLPLIGGAPRLFLGDGDGAPSWSPDGTQVAYFNSSDGDPLLVADRTGANARRIAGGEPGMHNHNPAWSPDGQWIYFVRGTEPIFETDMDLWRVRPSGESLERLTNQHAAVNFAACLDARTVLYVARSEDRSGPWLWTLDVETKATRKASASLDRYLSVAASRDGQRIVATVANPTSALWRVPILLDRPAEERDVTAHVMPETLRAYAPRFHEASMFYLSGRGANDGLWRFQDGEVSEVVRATERPLSEPAAVAPDGKRLAVIVRQDNKRRLMIMSADGARATTLAPALEILGAGGQGMADWSPDGAWIVAGGADANGPGLFKIPVAGGSPIRLVEGQALNPIWSPDGSLILYSGAFVTGFAPLGAVRPDGTRVALAPHRVRQGAYRFLPNSHTIVYMPALHKLDLFSLDVDTMTNRQLTRLADRGRLQTFDVTPDGKFIVFDRSRDNSRIVVIDRPE